jgi:phosphohistidine swiveling domain-containing protein
MNKQSLVFKLINQIVDHGIDIVQVDINEKAVDNTPNVPSASKIRRKVKFRRLDGDGDQMTSILSPTGEDNVPVANVVARYASLGVELIDRDILEDRLNGLSLEQAAKKYKMDQAEISKREVRVAAAMRQLGEEIPSSTSPPQKIGLAIGSSRRSRVGSLSKPASPTITATGTPKKRGRPPLPEAVQAERRAALQAAKEKKKRDRKLLSDAVRAERRAAQGPVRAKRGRKKLTEAERNGIISDLQAGMPLSEIVSKYSISAQTLSTISRESGLSGRLKKGPGRPLPPETQDAIFKDHDENPDMTVMELAAKYSVDPKSVLKAFKNSSVGEDGKRKSTDNTKINAIVERLKNTNDNLQEIAKDFGVSRQYVDMVGKKFGLRTTKRTRKAMPSQPEPANLPELRDFVRDNPSVTLEKLQNEFPGIGIERIRKERNKIIGVDKDTRMTSVMNQVTKLYDELAYEGMTTKDRSALAGIIAEELNMPVNRVSLLISRISTRSKSKKGNKLSNAVREYETTVRKNPSVKKGELLRKIAKKYDTTPASIMALIQSRKEGEGKGRGAEVIAAFTKRAEEENFFMRPRLAVYGEIGKEIGMSSATVQRIVSQYSRVKYPDEKAKADFKKANITPRDYRMLKSLLSGTDIKKIAQANKLTEKEVFERTELLKGLLRKHNKPLKQWSARDTDAPTPLPLPPTRRRFWSEMGRLRDDENPDEVIAKGLAASPGTAVGKVYFTTEEAITASERGEKVILVQSETSPEDVQGIMVAEGVLTARGGLVSHAAIFARDGGKPAVVGAEAVKIDGKKFTVGDIIVKEGDVISLNGTTGEIFLGKLPSRSASPRESTVLEKSKPTASRKKVGGYPFKGMTQKELADEYATQKESAQKILNDEESRRLKQNQPLQNILSSLLDIEDYELTDGKDKDSLSRDIQSVKTFVDQKLKFESTDNPLVVGYATQLVAISNLLKLRSKQRALTADETKLMKDLSVIFDDDGDFRGGNDRPLMMNRISANDFVNSSFDSAWIYPDGTIYPVRLAHENEFDLEDAWEDGLVRLVINRGRLWKKVDGEFEIINGEINFEVRRDLTDDQKGSLNTLFGNIPHASVYMEPGGGNSGRYSDGKTALKALTGFFSTKSKKTKPVAPSVKINNTRLESVYGAASPEGSGNCYEAAMTTAETIGKRIGVQDSSVRITHGVPLGTGGDAQGIRYNHAWVEVASNGWDEYDRVSTALDKLVDESKNVKDPTRAAELRKQYNELVQKLIQIEAEDITVYDYSNGKKIEMARMLYYAFGNIERQHALYYSIGDARKEIVNNSHFGPWG